MIKYKFGEIVLIEFPQLGSGQKKKRPALVILDIGDADIILAPITSKRRDSQGDYNIKDWDNSGLLLKSWVRLAKLSCLEKRDIVRTLGTISENDKNNLIILWKELFKLK